MSWSRAVSRVTPPPAHPGESRSPAHGWVPAFAGTSGGWIRSCRDGSRAAFRGAVPLVLALLVGGCLRPLYGPTASGVPLRDELAAVQIETVLTPPGQERFGHYLRSELIFGLNGSGIEQSKRYRLTLDSAESVQVTTVDTVTGRADAAILNVTVKYALKSLDGTRQLTAGTARGTATYNRDPQRFASVRAARDAEIRVAGLVAEDLKNRLAAMFATAP